MTSIPQVDVLDSLLLPIDAQRVITEHRHVLFGEISGNAPLVHLEVRRGPSTFIDYQALPIIHSVQHADHSIYAAVRHEQMDDGLDPFLLPADIPFGSISESTGNISGTDYRGTNPPNASAPSGYDSAPGDTFISYSDDDDPANYDQMFGFVLQYKAPWRLDGTPNYWDAVGGPGFVRLEYENDVSPTSENAARLVATYNVPYAQNPQTLIGIVPPAHIFSTWNQYDPLNPKNGNVSWSLTLQVLIEASTLSAFGDAQFVFYPLMKDTARLEALGKNNLFIPAANPQQVMVRGIVPPEAEHDFPDWPGGPLTVQVARQHYAGGDTVIDVEQIGPRPTESRRLEGMQRLHDGIALRERIRREVSRETTALMLARRS